LIEREVPANRAADKKRGSLKESPVDPLPTLEGVRRLFEERM
jgi:hypothetical protein